MTPHISQPLWHGNLHIQPFEHVYIATFPSILRVIYGFGKVYTHLRHLILNGCEGSSLK